jgi:hypothetical protein
MPACALHRRDCEPREQEWRHQANDAEASHMSAIMRALFTAGAPFSCCPLHGPSS